MDNDFWDWATLILVVSAALATLIFVGGYLIGSRWWRNPVGRNTMAFMVIVAITLILTVVFRVVGITSPGWLRVAIWVGINIPLWKQVFLLRKAQRQPAQRHVHMCTSCGRPCVG